MADIEDEDLSEFETRADAKDSTEADAIRQTVAYVYTFVRAAEINRTIASFTLDHYIDEAKRDIKDPRILRAASDPSKGVGTRPAKLERLERLERDFNNVYAAAKKLAEQRDAGTVES